MCLNMQGVFCGVSWLAFVSGKGTGPLGRFLVPGWLGAGILGNEGKKMAMLGVLQKAESLKDRTSPSDLRLSLPFDLWKEDIQFCLSSCSCSVAKS